MDTVLDRLSEIEETAGAIVDEANARKKVFARDMEVKTSAFDKELEQETSRRISGIRQKMEADMKALLDKQKADSEDLLKKLETNYDRRHESYVEALFQKMIKE